MYYYFTDQKTIKSNVTRPQSQSQRQIKSRDPDQSVCTLCDICILVMRPHLPPESYSQ